MKSATNPTGTAIQLDDAVNDIMSRWPQTMSVFIRRRMACPGCPMAEFMSVRDAARSYELDAAELLNELREAAEAASQDA